MRHELSNWMQFVNQWTPVPRTLDLSPTITRITIPQAANAYITCGRVVAAWMPHQGTEMQLHLLMREPRLARSDVDEKFSTLERKSGISAETNLLGNRMRDGTG